MSFKPRLVQSPTLSMMETLLHPFISNRFYISNSFNSYSPIKQSEPIKKSMSVSPVVRDKTPIRPTTSSVVVVKETTHIRPTTSSVVVVKETTHIRPTTSSVVVVKEKKEITPVRPTTSSVLVVREKKEKNPVKPTQIVKEKTPVTPKTTTPITPKPQPTPSLKPSVKETSTVPSVKEERLSEVMVVQVAKQLLQENKLIDWSFRFENGKSVAGRCIYNEKVIAISKRLLTKTMTEVRNVILHEIAHALAGYSHGHDEVWKSISLSIGGDGQRCHTMQLAEPKYNISCQCGAVNGIRHRLTDSMKQRIQSGHCPKCKGKVTLVQNF